MFFTFKRKQRIRKKANHPEYLTHKHKALDIAHQKIAHFNQIYQFSVNNITIKNQKTRWGSCSKKGNLNFNYKIALLPKHLADYVIVHELCHLKEFNHSKNFWNLVAKTIPNYQEIKKELSRLSLAQKNASI
jgi:predicted metal-dependent hydrolase